jgi:hypothetical protein
MCPAAQPTSRLELHTACSNSSNSSSSSSCQTDGAAVALNAGNTEACVLTFCTCISNLTFSTAQLPLSMYKT